jgi:hypothetical protein
MTIKQNVSAFTNNIARIWQAEQQLETGSIGIRNTIFATGNYIREQHTVHSAWKR